MLNPVNFTDLGPKRLLHVREVLVAFQVPAAAQRVHVLLVDLGGLVVPVEVRTPNGEPVEHRARSGAGGSSMAGEGTNLGGVAVNGKKIYEMEGFSIV
jgi:hypothetical protein